MNDQAHSATHASTPVFILAGGRGTRISEESSSRPKPMVEIGDLPILVHIMRWYYRHGFNDFVILGGYKVWEIKNYFLNYEYRANHLVVDHRESHTTGARTFGQSAAQERWRVRVLDTGLDTMTGARVAQGLQLVSETETFTDFALTYGDGLSDINLTAEFLFHKKHGKIGTVLGIPPPSRFGELQTNTSGKVESFLEKPKLATSRISGGFFFFKTDFKKHLKSNADCVLETEPLAELGRAGELMMFTHEGFWQPMDTLRDKTQLEDLWNSGQAPWKT